MDPLRERRLGRNVAFFVLRQIVRYVGFFINVPYVFSLAAMFGAIAIVPEDVYLPRAAASIGARTFSAGR
ncbi:MAG TPA: hypothetical protein VL284_13525 [Thermoanaerobaculia bacterium]|nr:hypothetical protein [Thermoanaerobaculia bacterium]